MDKPTRTFARDATSHPQTAATGPPYTYAVGKPPAQPGGVHPGASPQLQGCRVLPCVSVMAMQVGMHADDINCLDVS